jgi:hypothetical protein
MKLQIDPIHLSPGYTCAMERMIDGHITDVELACGATKRSPTFRPSDVDDPRTQFAPPAHELNETV